MAVIPGPVGRSQTVSAALGSTTGDLMYQHKGGLAKPTFITVKVIAGGPIEVRHVARINGLHGTTDKPTNIAIPGTPVYDKELFRIADDGDALYVSGAGAEISWGPTGLVIK